MRDAKLPEETGAAKAADGLLRRHGYAATADAARAEHAALVASLREAREALVEEREVSVDSLHWIAAALGSPNESDVRALAGITRTERDAAVKRAEEAESREAALRAGVEALADEYAHREHTVFDATEAEVFGHVESDLHSLLAAAPQVVPAAELATLRAEVERLTRERDEARNDQGDSFHRLTELYAVNKLVIAGRDAAETSLAQARERIAALEGALGEWVAAHDGERKAARHAAHVRVREYRKWPAPPKRMPKNAVLMSSLSPEEQRRINEQCAKDMAPIEEAEGLHRAARDRLDAALASARALLPPAAPAKEAP